MQKIRYGLLFALVAMFVVSLIPAGVYAIGDEGAQVRTVLKELSGLDFSQEGCAAHDAVLYKKTADAWVEVEALTMYLDFDPNTGGRCLAQFTATTSGDYKVVVEGFGYSGYKYLRVDLGETFKYKVHFGFVFEG